mmetsp:Transcript_102493/g.182089  ORF Transcript_102493/g.182089 Transcript_102493/m.182089 type:complete len:216 (-) Transcript_102493:18-665(-)|eukprot:CAMPEP_0197653628 /NCGR_PEP_ID=MMETSP1338-20131121/36489_1 /TAXON_ID=43686 ORGANISM="Pelagodinium beii, Strain RCC1491" /NCGR_SAMPLE_ID=MMETSP1338 /ASSEMBLY_ACC=CAM_ASM_000754 /LENGTH=215 /DNA_ID=CAMNT_0043228819 /DNA_START=54 /DNA_END=701 /DNA_ORIENTATION=+
MGLGCLALLLTVNSFFVALALGDDFDDAVSLVKPASQRLAPRLTVQPRLRPSSQPRISPSQLQALEDHAQARLHSHSAPNLMSKFMRNFAQNMRYEVLQDSKGDIPEQERLAEMRAIEEDRQRANGPPLPSLNQLENPAYEPSSLPSFQHSPASFDEEDAEQPKPRHHRQHVKVPEKQQATSLAAPPLPSKELQKSHSAARHSFPLALSLLLVLG